MVKSLLSINNSFSWFDLNKYDAISEGNAEMWSAALSRRHHCNEYLDYVHSNITGCTIEKFDMFFNLLTQELGEYMHDPFLLKDGPHGDMGRTVRETNVACLADFFRRTTSISSIRKFWFHLVNGTFPNKSHNQKFHEEFYRARNKSIDHLHNKKGVDFIEYTGGTTLVTVDLEAPTKKLVQDFKLFIENHKKSLSIEPIKYFTESDFTRWHNNRILPYLDITLWAKRSNLRLTRNEIGNAIFPDLIEIDIEDKIKRSVEPLALKLGSESILYALSAQAT